MARVVGAAALAGAVLTVWAVRMLSGPGQDVPERALGTVAVLAAVGLPALGGACLALACLVLVLAVRRRAGLWTWALCGPVGVVGAAGLLWLVGGPDLGVGWLLFG